MRKIEKEMALALYYRRDYHNSNTEVEWLPDGLSGCKGWFAEIRLHGNVIGRYWRTDGATLEDGTEIPPGWRITLTDAGWQTATTKGRLNALLAELVSPRIQIRQDGGVWKLISTKLTPEGLPSTSVTSWPGSLPFNAKEPRT